MNDGQPPQQPQGQPPFAMMPMPFWPPWQQPQDHHGQTLGNEVPARVRVAMEFLRQLSAKETPQVAVTGFVQGPGSIEVLDGLKLTKDEIVAQNHALAMLSDFFRAQMQNNNWEELYTDSAERDLEQREGVTIVCPVCEGRSRIPGSQSNCLLCRNGGRVVAFPASER